MSRLRELIGEGTSRVECARLMGRSHQSIQHAIVKHRLQRRRQWTTADDEMVRSRFSLREVAEMLERTEPAVRTRAHRLGYSRR